MEILKLTNELFPKKFRDDINHYAEIVLNYYKRNSEDDFRYHSEYLMKCDTRISWLKKYTERIKDKSKFPENTSEFLFRDTTITETLARASFSRVWVSQTVLNVLNDNIKYLNQISKDDLNEELGIDDIMERASILINTLKTVLLESDDLFNAWVRPNPTNEGVMLAIQQDRMKPSVVS